MSTPGLAAQRWACFLWAGWLLLGSADARAQEKGVIDGHEQLWFKLSYEHWHAEERYAGKYGEDLESRGLEVGDPIPLKLDQGPSSFDNAAMSLEVRAVPIDRLMLRAYMPVYQRSVFDEPTQTVETSGTGDLFSFVGYQITPTRWPVGVALYFHQKFPTTGPRLDELSVPLSEGQVDLALEGASSWAPLLRLHLTASLLYRIRFEVETASGDSLSRRKPGNEVELAATVGGAPLSLLWLKLGYKGLWGAPSEDRSTSIPVVLEERQIHTLTPALYYRFGSHIAPELELLALDAAFRYPLGGVDFLRGPHWSLGLAYGFSWQN